MPIGATHHRLDETPSTNDVARGLAQEGAEHGTVVSTARQTAGKGRQGRDWAGADGAIAVSVVVREPVDRLLPLRAGLAVARLAGPAARVKWPNDVLVDGRKVAGVLVEAEGSAAIVGIGVNVAVELADLPDDVAARAATLGLKAADVDAAQDRLLELLEETLALTAPEVVAALAARDALVGKPVRWAGGDGIAAGMAEDGSLRVQTAAGAELLLDGGEIHLL
ncbi:MAG: biotin--[acetyl-CoA-carboxylase] ligase [Solirubrobacteraceae bacterium]|nr:biotin--[acetyl-CoA-carboxylase] ligase [Solirubrobacteraceae bacterium]